MKATRIKNTAIVTAPPSKQDEDLQVGKKVLLRAIPKDIKKAKRFFTVGKQYKIKEPPENHINSEMAVYLKADDENVYCVGFPAWTKCS